MKVQHLPRRAGPTVAEGEYLAQLAQRVPPGGTIIEIGSCVGISTAWMGTGNQTTKIYAVDAWELGDTPHSLRLYYDVFLLNMAAMGFTNRVKPIKGFSVEVAATWTLRADLLYIDGAHDYDNVKADILAWEPKLKVGGWLAFHDVNQPEVHRAIQDTLPPKYGTQAIHGRIMSVKKER